MEFLALSKDFIDFLWLLLSTKKCPPAIIAKPNKGILFNSILDIKTIWYGKPAKTKSISRADSWFDAKT